MEFTYLPVTQKGQVTLPIAFRRQHGIKTRSKVKAQSTKKGIIITADDTPDFLSLAGTLKPKKVYDAVKLRDLMENTYSRT